MYEQIKDSTDNDTPLSNLLSGNNLEGIETILLDAAKQATALKLEKHAAVYGELAQEERDAYEARVAFEELLPADTSSADYVTSIIEFERARSRRLSCPTEVLDWMDLVNDGAMYRALSFPPMFDPALYPDHFVKVTDEDEFFHNSSTVNFYIQNQQFDCPNFINTLATHQENYPAGSHRYTPWDTLIASNHLPNCVNCNYIGTTHSTTPHGQFQHDKQMSGSQITNWYCDSSHIQTQIFKFQKLNIALKSTQLHSKKQTYCLHGTAAGLEEALVNLSPYFLHSMQVAIN